MPLALLLFAVMAGAPPPPAAAQGQTHLVLAFYYAWYSPSSFGPGKTAYQPVEPYYSGDAATIQRQVNQARSAGIDGFVQSWYGPGDPNTNGNLATLLDVASGSGFKAAVDFEPTTFLSSHEERANALSTLLATHATHPAYLRVDGKPVIFFWANWAYSVEEWATIRNLADPGRDSIWIAEGGNVDYLSVFDGLHLYNTAWSANPAGLAATWGANTRAAAETYAAYKYWVATAMPGFDDRHLGRGDQAVYRDRAAGAYYQNSFAGAASSAPDMLIITSFNEWAEGSNIEPSVAFGNRYLELTAQLSAAFKSGNVAQPPPLAQATGDPSPTPFPTGAPDTSPTALPSNTPVATTTTVASPTPQTDGRIVYEVAAGDTLSAIAFRFQVPLDDLYAYNDLSPDSVLTIGQPLILGFAAGSGGAPPSPPAVPEGVELGEDGAYLYTIAEGDTLIAIAVRFDLTLPELYAMNEGVDENTLLRVGDQLVVGQRRQPQDTGGSTDFPEGTGTAAPAATLASTTTATPTPAPASPTPLPTLTLAPAVIAALTGTPAAAATPRPAATLAALPPTGNFLPGNFLALLAGCIVLLGVTGVLFLFLGRRR